MIYNMLIKISSARIVGLGLSIALIFSAKIQAEPYLGVLTGNQCSACHINPLGGGARNAFGTYYGNQVLPAKAYSDPAFDPGAISEFLRLGGDLRFNYDQSESEDENNQTFSSETGQLYLTIQPKDLPFIIYLDQKILPNAASSREAFALFKQGQHYIKAGKMILPYGLRIEDDSAYIREATQMNFNNSDSGIELGLGFGKTAINVAVTNGTSAARNNDNKLQYLFRGEYVEKIWRAGGGFVHNDTDNNERQMANVFAGLNLKGHVLLAEISSIEDTFTTDAGETKTTQQVILLEMNKAIIKGLNTKLTTEYHDPNDDVSGDQRRRHSILLEYTPHAFVQLRGGYRKENGDQVSDTDNIFVQLHMYY